MNDTRPLLDNAFDNRMRKLVPTQVRDIRRRYAEGGVSFRALGEEYHVTGQTIADIVSGYTWTWLDDGSESGVATG